MADCLFCHRPDATHAVKPRDYYGTVTYVLDAKEGEYEPWYFCDKDCYNKWWNDVTWHLDTLDERMNVNTHFQRTSGSKGIYKGKPVDASWNGLEARHLLGEYEFAHRRPHPVTCTGCCL